MSNVFSGFPGWDKVIEMRKCETPFLLKGASHAFIPGIFSPDDFETLLEKKLSIGGEFLQITKDGKLLFPTKDRTPLPSRTRITELYRQGHTIVCNFISSDVPGLLNSKLYIQDRLRSEVECSTFITPSSSQGFSAHFDSADLFIVQTYGSKKWALYEAKIRAAIEEQKAAVSRDEMPPLIFEETIFAGDVLYIPRGVIHEGITEDTTQSSIHISFGILTTKVYDVLKLYIDELALRESWLREDVSVDIDLELLSSRLLSALREESLFEYYRARIKDKLTTDILNRQKISMNGALGITNESLSQESILSLKQGILCQFSHANPSILMFSGYEGALTLTIPVPAVPIVKEILAKRSSFSMKDLTAFDEYPAATFATVKKLFEHGIIEAAC
jgi:hypothetical protein